MKPLRECLQGYDKALLEAIAATRAVVLEDAVVLEMAENLAETLADEASLQGALRRLGDEARRAFQELVGAGGSDRLVPWERRWGSIRAFGPGRLRREEPWRQPANVSERLWYLGLISTTFERGADRTLAYVFVPTDLLPAIESWLGDQPAPMPGPSPTPTPSEPAIVSERGSFFLEAQLAYLVYLYNHRAKVTVSGRLRDRDRQSLLAYLESHVAAEVEEGPFRFLDALTREQGLVQPDDGALRPDPDRLRIWLHLGDGLALAEAQGLWMDTLSWNDLWQVPTLRCESTGWMNDPRQARSAVVRLLRRCEVGVWYPVSGLIAWLKETDPDFQRPEGDYDSWFIRGVDTGEYLLGFDSWDQVEGALIRYLLAGPLHWLGVVDLGDGGESVRISPGAAGLLGGVASGEEPEAGQAHFADRFLIQTPPTVGRYERFQLSRMAQWLEDTSPPQYRLTARSIGRALRQGLQLGQIESFLERLTGTPVPANVTRSMATWAQRAREVCLRRTVLLEVQDAELLDRVIEEPDVRRLLGERVSDTRLVVPERNAQALARVLARLGYNVRAQKG